MFSIFVFEYIYCDSSESIEAIALNLGLKTGNFYGNERIANLLTTRAWARLSFPRHIPVLQAGKLSSAPFFGFSVHYNFFVAFGFFGDSGHRPTIWVMGNNWQLFFEGFT